MNFLFIFHSNVELFIGGISNVYYNYCFPVALALTNFTNLRAKFKFSPAQGHNSEH